MQRISFAPVLSATLSRDSCWITSNSRVSRRFSFLSLAEPTLSEPPWRRGVAGPGGPAPSLGLLENLDHAPPLGGGQRPGLHQEHAVADPAGVVLVVGLVLLGTADDLAVQRVLDAVLDGDHNGLVHLVADHHALAGLAVA